MLRAAATGWPLRRPVSTLPATYCPGFHDEAAVRRMRYRPLGRTGLQLSSLGFGASALAGVFGPADEQEAVATVRAAIRAGVNYIDTAPWYGQGASERVLGRALEGVPRQAYYLATKACRFHPEPERMFDFSLEGTRRSVGASCERLGVESVDLIQVHDPEFCGSFPQDITDGAYRGLLQAKQDGRARLVGLTGYPLGNFRAMVDSIEQSGLPLPDSILSYAHYTLLDSALLDLAPWVHSLGIGLMNASPIAMGLLSSGGPPEWHPALPAIKQAARQAATVCAERDVDLARLAMHFSLHTAPDGTFATTLVSCVDRSMLAQNLESEYESQLSEREMECLETVRERFFLPLGNATWEGVELAAHKEAIAKLGTHRH